MKLNHMTIMAVLLFLMPLSGQAGEDCAHLFGGACRDACSSNETAEAGAFEDCGEKQECCVGRAAEETRCCVLSFEQKDHGPFNCTVPEHGACLKGSASAVPCEKLFLCK